MRALAISLVVLVPLASGVAATAVIVPGYISDHIGGLANVSASDVGALEWAGAHLPACSAVLVAPGSVGQYLPEYAAVAVVFPAFPVPANLSYSLVVTALQEGNYTPSTHEQLLELHVTEVLVSGQNSVSYAPFRLGPLLGSPDFAILYTGGDVTVLEFVPGANATGCPP